MLLALELIQTQVPIMAQVPTQMQPWPTVKLLTRASPQPHIPVGFDGMLSALESANKGVLVTLAQSHGVTIPSRVNLNGLWGSISAHICDGFCAISSRLECLEIMSTLRCEFPTSESVSRSDLHIYILSFLVSKINLRASPSYTSTVLHSVWWFW